MKRGNEKENVKVQGHNVKEFRILAGSRWHKVTVSGIGEEQASILFNYHGKQVRINAYIPARYEDYEKAKITLLVDNYIRNENSREAIRKTAEKLGEKITFL